MINLLLRGLIVYIIVIVSVRFMGKRQIGELQPSELVTTFLLSEVASMPLQNKDISLFSCIVLILLLISLEVIFSVIAVKSDTFRALMQGSSVLVIKDGKLLQSKIRQLRYSIDDLLESLRLKDVFDISQVKYAYVETNGSISVVLKESCQPVTKKDLKLPYESASLACLVISDGKIVEKDFELCSMTKQKLEKVVKKMNLEISDIFIMTANRNGQYTVIKKEECQ